MSHQFNPPINAEQLITQCREVSDRQFKDSPTQATQHRIELLETKLREVSAISNTHLRQLNELNTMANAITIESLPNDAAKGNATSTVPRPAIFGKD